MRVRKGTIIMFAIAIFLILAIGAVKYAGPNISWVDRHGFKHNAKTEAVYSDNNDANLNYLVIQASKEEFKAMDSHAFLERITPVLNANEGKEYVTFRFGDGTGIYFPKADMNLEASYGDVDENGQLVNRIGYIIISGAQVAYEALGSEFSRDSIDAEEVLPDEYKNDDLSACVDEGILYLNVAKTALNQDEAFQVGKDVAKEYLNGDFNMSKIHSFYIALNYKYGFIVNLRTGDIKQDNSVIKEVMDKNGISNTEVSY